MSFSIFPHEGACSRPNCCERTFDWLAHIPPPSVALAGPSFVEVNFGKGVRRDFFKLGELAQVNMGDTVVVAAAKGYDMGTIALKGYMATLQMQRKGYVAGTHTLAVLRKATPEDLHAYTLAAQREGVLLEQGRRFAKDLGLVMKISQVYVQRDGRKAVFYYIAEERVDFRALLKKYAEAFRLNIEMRHIDPRQEAKQVGGMGACGRPLCCTTWMTAPKNVNIQAVRYQRLTLNKNKLDGQCGRLKCCLNFELDSYTKMMEDMPAKSEFIETNLGKGKLIRKDIFRSTFTYSFVSGALRTLGKKDVLLILSANEKGQLYTLEEETYKDTQGSDFNNVEGISIHSLGRGRKHKKRSLSK